MKDNLTDPEWRDWCERPCSFGFVAFWAAVIIAGVCTLAVACGVAGYMAGYFN